MAARQTSTHSRGRSVRSGRSARAEEAVDSGSDGESCGVRSLADLDRERAEYDRVQLAYNHRLAVERQEAEALQDQVSDDEAMSSHSSAGSLLTSAEKRQEIYSAVEELAGRLSRASTMQMAARFRKGRVARGGQRPVGEKAQRVFGLEGSEALNELETAGGLYDKLRMGENVMVQYIARTGIGKTTRFASQISKKCGMRVLLLEPDVLLARVAADAQREKTVVQTRWRRTRGELLTTMTYSDFCGQFQVWNGVQMLKQFDVIIMDEAHIPMAEVYVAKALLATHATAEISLLVLSATMAGEDMQSSGGAAAMRSVRGDLVGAMLAGKLLTPERARDRTMFIVATDEDAARCHEYIGASGHISYLLDSASRISDVWAVCTAMKAQSVVKRFLVTTEKYGTGHNFPVSQVYTDGCRREYVMDEKTRVVDAVRTPVTVSELKQHCGRAGRGIVAGNQSFGFTGCGEAIPDVELLPSERVRAYLLLRAAGIIPLNSIKPPAGFFPFGVTPEVASDILAVNLPCELAVRYFNRDGCVSAAYARALAPFSQLDHYFITSAFDSAVGADRWVEDTLGGYYGMAATDVAVRVPFVPSDPELRLKMHAVAVIALGGVSIAKWGPQLSESEVSGDESVAGPSTSFTSVLPRLITDTTRAAPPRAIQEVPWGYDAQLENQAGYVGHAGDRGGVVPDAYTQATLDFLEQLDTDRVVEVPEAVVNEYEDKHGVLRVDVKSDTVAPAGTPVDVETPGGTVVVTLRKDVWLRMSQGEALDSVQMVSLMRTIKHNVKGFVASNAFANWSNVWLSILATCAEDKVLKSLVMRGLTVIMSTMLRAMYARYSMGVERVTKKSYARGRVWQKILLGRSVDAQMERARARGKLEVMQSEKFFYRISEIRTMTAIALHKMEDYGVFAPTAVTEVQSILPITDSTGIGLYDGIVKSQTSRYRRLIGDSFVSGSSSVRGHRRGSS